MDVTLQWDASSGAAGYKVYYTTGCPGPPYSGTGALEGSSPIDVGNVTGFKLHDIPDGGCRFALTAYNAYGESGYSTEVSTDPISPFIQGYPTIDYSNNTIEITFNESNIQNATIEDNYRFNPSLNFAGAGTDITPLSSRTYRLAMISIPEYTIITLTVTHIMDAACHAVMPSSIKLNDNDDDDMADDWEIAYSVVTPDDDPDDDGLTNVLEFQYSINPHDPDTDGDGVLDKWEIKVACDGDVDGDGDIDGTDLAELAADPDLLALFYFTIEFGHSNCGGIKSTCDGDFNGDGDIDGADLAERVAHPELLDLFHFSTGFGRSHCME